MAYIGLANPVAAKLTEPANTYADGAALGKAIGIDITPSYAEGSLNADNMQAEYDKVFAYADVSLNTSTIPISFQQTLFGHTVAEKKVTFKSTDQSAYVGFGFYVTEVVDGALSYVATWLHKVKFSEPAESYATKGENIEYKTPTITGRALPISTGDWKETEAFDAEEEAKQFLSKKYAPGA